MNRLLAAFVFAVVLSVAADGAPNFITATSTEQWTVVPGYSVAEVSNSWPTVPVSGCNNAQWAVLARCDEAATRTKTKRGANLTAWENTRVATSVVWVDLRKGNPVTMNGTLKHTTTDGSAI